MDDDETTGLDLVRARPRWAAEAEPEESPAQIENRLLREQLIELTFKLELLELKLKRGEDGTRRRRS